MRYKIILEYDGRSFIGWQRQPDGLGVQELIERAIFLFSGERTSVFCAGRTDKGVHALGQVSHFDLKSIFDPRLVIRAINFYLKREPISVLSCDCVDKSFHARFSAKKKTYLYKILSRFSKPSISEGLVWWVPEGLEENRMVEGGLNFVGTHDFTTFRSGRCQSGSSIRTIDHLSILRSGFLVEIKIEARSFLYNQVRNMVGILKLIGEKKLEPNYVSKALLAKERRFCRDKAPPCGLYLISVTY